MSSEHEGPRCEFELLNEGRREMMELRLDLKPDAIVADFGFVDRAFVVELKISSSVFNSAIRCRIISPEELIAPCNVISGSDAIRNETRFKWSVECSVWRSAVFLEYHAWWILYPNKSWFIVQEWAEREASSVTHRYACINLKHKIQCTTELRPFRSWRKKVLIE